MDEMKVITLIKTSHKKKAKHYVLKIIKSHFREKSLFHAQVSRKCFV